MKRTRTSKILLLSSMITLRHVMRVKPSNVSAARPTAELAFLQPRRISSWKGSHHDAGWRQRQQHRHSHTFAAASFPVSDDIISSRQSNTVKRIQALLTKRKKRTELQQTVVEGPRMVFDLLKNPKTNPLVRQVLVSTTWYDDDSNNFNFDYLPDYKNTIPTFQLVEPSIFNKPLSDTVHPQGILAVVDIPSTRHHQQQATPTTITSSSSSSSSSSLAPLYLLLDGVSDPGNMGTLLRTALAVGVRGVVLLPECCDVWNPKAVRSAMGASFQLPVIEQAKSWQAGLELLRQWNVQRVYAATMIEEEAQNGVQNNRHYDVDWTLSLIHI